MVRDEELKRLDAFTALLDDVQETLPKWTDIPYDLFAASATVCERLREWAVKKRAAAAEETPARGLAPTLATAAVGNAPEREPDKEWVWPGLERPAAGWERPAEPLAPAAASPPGPKAGTVSNPDF